MTVSHKDLTGTDLHEIKGASTATSGQVPIADGAGGAPFAKITHTSLDTTGNPFGAQLLHVREEGVAGASSACSINNAAWNFVNLNTTKTNEISGASIASSIVTLPAGTYHFRFKSPVYYWTAAAGFSGVMKPRLRNHTASTTIFVGTDHVIPIGESSSFCTMEGRFTLGGSTELSPQVYLQRVVAVAESVVAQGESACYGELYIWKVA